jgi:hypothetical protein
MCHSMRGACELHTGESFGAGRRLLTYNASLFVWI